MDEPWGQRTKWNKAITKIKYYMIPIKWIQRVFKNFVETENRMVVYRNLVEREIDGSFLMVYTFGYERLKVS